MEITSGGNEEVITLEKRKEKKENLLTDLL